MRFGLGVPTGTEGLMYPVPYADISQAVEMAVTAERLGFESVWGNDHASTQAYVRAEFDEPPRFYDPFTYFGFVAARTESVRLATAIMVLGFRHPAVAAKQVATLDQLSGGRVVLGVGIGAYREEFEALHPGSRVHRGEHATEAMQALRQLFEEPVCSYEGRWVNFREVASAPKPIQPRLPILSGGNAAGTRMRAARYGDGWLPACLSPAELRAGVDDIAEQAASAGRELPGDFEIALQVGVSVARTREQAQARFESSQLHNHLTSLAASTLRDQRGGTLADRNLIGTPDDVLERIEEYRDAGATTMAALLFAADSVEETEDAMSMFSESVIARASAAAVR